MPRGNISVSFRLHIHVGRNLWTRWRSNGGQALPLSERRYLDSLLPIGFVVSVGHLRSTRLWIIQLDDEWVRISSRIHVYSASRRRVSALPRMSYRFYRSFISHLCADTRLVGVAALCQYDVPSINLDAPKETCRRRIWEVEFAEKSWGI